MESLLRETPFAEDIEISLPFGMIEQPQGDKKPTDASPVGAGPPSTSHRDSISNIIKRLGAVAPLAISWSILPLIGTAALGVFMSTVGQWLRSADGWGPPLYIAGFALMSGLAIINTWMQALLGGFAFPLILGIPAALGGCVGGVLVGFAVSRVASGDRARKVIQDHPLWQAVYEELLGGGFWKTLGIVTLIRLNSPFALTNLAFTATRVPLLTYVVGTLAGLAPRTVAVVYIGSTLSDFGDATKPRWLIWTSIGVTLAIIIVISQLANRAIERFASSHDPRKESNENAASEPNR